MSTDPKPATKKTGKASKSKPQPSSATASTTSTPESQEEPTIDSLIVVQVGGVQRQAQFKIQQSILDKHDVSNIATMGQIFGSAAQKLFALVMTELLFEEPLVTLEEMPEDMKEQAFRDFDREGNREAESVSEPESEAPKRLN